MSGDYKKLKSRESNEGDILSDESLIQRKEIIEINIKNFKSAYEDAFELIDRLDRILCIENEGNCGTRQQIQKRGSYSIKKSIKEEMITVRTEAPELSVWLAHREKNQYYNELKIYKDIFFQ